MLDVCTLLIFITIFIHLLFFKLESIDFMKDKTLKRLGLNNDQAAVVKTWAFNQGFYNLFLALGLVYATFLLQGDSVELGKVLAQFILLTIVGAGLVLIYSAPDKYKAGVVQAAPALFALVFSLFI